MDRNQFLKRVNERAESRYQTFVKSRMLSDWIDEGIMSGPKPFGRQHVWGASHYRRALQICRLRSQGVKRYTALRIQLWLCDVDINFDELRESVKKEEDRNRNRLQRDIHSSHDPRSDGMPGDKTIAAIIKPMGLLSSVFSDVIQYQPKELYGAGALMRFSTEPGLFQKKVANFPKEILGSDLFNSEYTVSPELICKTISGILGAPDEIDNSLASTIDEASFDTFEISRRASFNTPWALIYLPELMPIFPDKINISFQPIFEIYKIIFAELKNPDWKLSIFLTFLHDFHRYSEEKKCQISDLLEMIEALRYKMSDQEIELFLKFAKEQNSVLSGDL